MATSYSQLSLLISASSSFGLHEVAADLQLIAAVQIGLDKLLEFRSSGIRAGFARVSEHDDPCLLLKLTARSPEPCGVFKNSLPPLRKSRYLEHR